MKDAALVILVILGGLAVVAMAVFAGGDRSLFVAPPDATAESFVRELGMERYELAANYLSDDLRRQVPASKLRSTFEPLRRDIGRPDQIETQTSSMTGDHARVFATFEGRRRTATMYVDLVRERGLWRIANWPLDMVQRP